MEVNLTFADGLMDGPGRRRREKKKNAGKVGLELGPQPQPWLVLWGLARVLLCCDVKRRKIPAPGKQAMARGDSGINHLEVKGDV